MKISKHNFIIDDDPGLAKSLVELPFLPLIREH